MGGGGTLTNRLGAKRWGSVWVLKLSFPGANAMRKLRMKLADQNSLCSSIGEDKDKSVSGGISYGLVPDLRILAEKKKKTLADHVQTRTPCGACYGYTPRSRI